MDTIVPTVALHKTQKKVLFITTEMPEKLATINDLVLL